LKVLERLLRAERIAVERAVPYFAQRWRSGGTPWFRQFGARAPPIRWRRRYRPMDRPERGHPRKSHFLRQAGPVADREVSDVVSGNDPGVEDRRVRADVVAGVALAAECDHVAVRIGTDAIEQAADLDPGVDLAMAHHFRCDQRTEGTFPGASELFRQLEVD